MLAVINDYSVPFIFGILEFKNRQIDLFFFSCRLSDLACEWQRGWS